MLNGNRISDQARSLKMIDTADNNLMDCFDDGIIDIAYQGSSVLKEHKQSQKRRTAKSSFAVRREPEKTGDAYNI